MAELTILQLNCRSLRSNFAEIEDLLITNEIHVACFNETKCAKTQPKIKGYVLASFVPHSYRGSSIYVKQELEYKELLNTSIDEERQEAIRIETLGIEITNIYAAPQSTLDPNLLSSTSDRHLIVGDLNAKCHELGSECSNQSGEALEEFVDDHDYIILNDSQATHDKGGILDVHIASCNLTKFHSSFRLGPDVGSDHRPTISCFRHKVPVTTTRCNWALYRRLLEEEFDQTLLVAPSNPEEVDQHSRRLTALCTAKLEESSRRFKGLPTSPLVRDLLRMKKRLLRRRAKLRRRGLCLNEVNHQLNWTRRNLRAGLKRDEEKRQLKIINTLNRGHSNDFWKVAKALFKEKRYTNHLQITNQEAAFQFAERLRIKCTKNDSPEEIFIESLIEKSKQLLAPRVEPPNNCEDFTVHSGEIEEMLRLKKNTSPGDDKITYQMLKNLPQKMKTALALLITCSLQLGHVPLDWKDTKVKMINKPGKDPTQLKNYRPISLNSCIGKLAETAMKTRLLDFCESKDVFGPFQSAYRTGRNTTDNLLTLMQTVQKNYRMGLVSAAVFLDVEKAFDAVWHEGLMFKLISLHLPTEMIRWIYNYLKGRKITVSYQHALSESFSPNAGVPQGSVISPVLFNIFVSKPDRSSQISQFADDIALYDAGITQKGAVMKLQRSLDKMNEWCKLWKINLNADKTKLMVFTRERKEQVKITLDGETIEPTDDTQFLGATVQSDMRWNKHISEIETRMSQRIGKLRLMRAKGVRPQILLFLYKTMIRRIATYAAAAWINAPEYQIQRIQLQQNKALRVCFNEPKWTRISELHERANILPIKAYNQQEAMNYIIRAKNAKLEPIMSLWNEQREERSNWRNNITPMMTLQEWL